MNSTNGWRSTKSIDRGTITFRLYFSEFSAEFDSGICAGTSLPNSSERWHAAYPQRDSGRIDLLGAAEGLADRSVIP